MKKVGNKSERFIQARTALLKFSASCMALNPVIWTGCMAVDAICQTPESGGCKPRILNMVQISLMQTWLTYEYAECRPAEWEGGEWETTMRDVNGGAAGRRIPIDLFLREKTTFVDFRSNRGQWLKFMKSFCDKARDRKKFKLNIFKKHGTQHTHSIQYTIFT